jgi:hypothetical protein
MLGDSDSGHRDNQRAVSALHDGTLCALRTARMLIHMFVCMYMNKCCKNISQGQVCNTNPSSPKHMYMHMHACVSSITHMHMY